MQADKTDTEFDNVLGIITTNEYNVSWSGDECWSWWYEPSAYGSGKNISTTFVPY